MIEGTASRLRDALRLALFLNVPETRLVSSWAEIVAAAFLTLFIPTAYAFLVSGGEGVWSLARLPEALWLVPTALVAATFAARIVRRSDAVPVIVFATLLTWMVVDAVSLAAWAIAIHVNEVAAVAHSNTFFVLPLAWLALAVTHFAASLGAVGGLRKLIVLVACALFLAVPAAFLQPERSLWVKDWSRDEGGAGSQISAASEEVLYRQPELLENALEKMQPGRKGVIDVFFVGLAGYGRQDVFMREVDSVALLMRTRFGAEGRSVKLVNNPKTLLDTPIATLTSLRATLNRVAELMNGDEDVLVLFLTSHGSADHKFSLDLWPLKLNELDPGALRKALDESGIRNRVVVVSACYSGGFVEPLRDDNTLVITAAARDRNSFGCGNENEWTYFGRAYFDEGLRKTHSFTDAFRIAMPLIEERERAEKFEPSRPQMAAGAGIRAKLAALEQQLENGARLAGPGAEPKPGTF